MRVYKLVYQESMRRMYLDAVKSGLDCTNRGPFKRVYQKGISSVAMATGTVMG